MAWSIPRPEMAAAERGSRPGPDSSGAADSSRARPARSSERSSAPPSRTGSHVIDVEPSEAGERLDVFLHRHFPEHSRSQLKRWVDEERVTVGGRTVRASRMLRPGESITIDVPPPPPPMPIPQDIPLDVIHEDDCFLVIRKPAGLVVHPGAGNVAGGTLVNALLSHTDQLSTEAGDFRPGIVHRLDRETSGLMVIARDDDTHRRIAAQFKARMVKKEYLALSHGQPKESDGRIDEPLGRSLVDRKKMAIRPDAEGKASLTLWRTVGTIGGFTWFRCFPHTGRTHQIRVHLKSIGHPIACDYHYGRERELTLAGAFGRKPQGKEPVVLARHALHAFRLSFRHPDDGRALTFEAPLPEDMQTLWDASTIDDAALASAPPAPPPPEELPEDARVWLEGRRTGVGFASTEPEEDAE